MNARNINVLLTGNASQLRSTLVAAGNDVKKFDKTVESSGASTSRAAKIWGVAAKAGVLVLAASLIYAAGAAVGFERRMRNVNSISGLSEGALRSLGDEVRSMSEQLPQSANELAEGLYDIASSGFQGADGLTVLRSSAEAASAGLTTTATSAKAIVAVLNAYGMTAADAAHVSDVLFQGVNVGVMSFEELAGTVGDFVGMAAAAGISIEETTAAMAAMTLAGISAAESGTSLNRLMQSLIQPSKSLAQMFSSWGYESGEAAVNALGLRGVMERLRESTGGNVTALLTLFPEIRAARGAFALMANDGKNYAKASKAMADADEGQGATKRALAEQMKSLSAQWELFVNWVNSAAISIGMKVLPALNDLLDGAKNVGSSIGSFVADAADALAPFFDDLISTFEDLWSTAQKVAEALGPTVKLLLQMAGGSILGMLMVLGKTLSFAADMADRFSGVITAVVVALGVMKAASVGGAGLAALGALWERVAYQATLAKLAFRQAAEAAALQGASQGGQFMAGLKGLGLNPITAALAAFTVAVVGVGSAMAREKGKAKAWAKEFRAALDIDPNNLYSVRDAVKKTGDEMDKLQKKAGTDHGWHALRELSQLVNPWESNGITEARERFEELEKQQVKNVKREEILRANTRKLAEAYGMTAGEAARFAKRNKIDLGGSFMDVNDIVDKTDKKIRDHGKQLGRNAQEMKAFSEMSIEAMEEAAKAETDFLDEVQKGLQSSQDIVSKFGKEGVGAQGLKEFYDDALKQTNDFSANVSRAVQMGLDPNVLKRILTAGPAEAGKLLENIVGDSTGAMIDLVNNAEAALAEANARLLEMARITHRATTAESQTMVEDAATAMKISMLTMEKGANTSAENIARSLGIGIDDVTRIADEYGIVVERVNGQPIDPKINPKGAKELAASLKEVEDNLRAFSKVDPKVKVAADIQDPVAKFQALRDIALEYVNSNPTTKAKFESLDAEGKMQYLVGLIGDGSLWTAYAQLNTEGLSDAAQRVRSALMAIVSTDPTAIAYLDTHNADENVAFLKRKLMEYAQLHPEAQADVATALAELDFQTLNGWATAWGGRSETADANVQVNGQGEAERILANLTRDRVARINVAVSGGVGSALDKLGGGRWGAIRGFRYGGTATPAHVTNRELFRYGEPETGGEAFIPRKGHKGRSLMVLDRAAGWYGMQVVPMAKGGLNFSGPASKAAPKAKEVSEAWQKWYDALPQLNRDIYDAGVARANSRVRAKKFHPQRFPWAQRLGPTPAEPARYGNGSGSTTHVFVQATTQINAPVYGVHDLEKAIDKGVTKSVEKNYGKFSKSVRNGEDARK